MLMVHIRDWGNPNRTLTKKPLKKAVGQESKESSKKVVKESSKPLSIPVGQPDSQDKEKK